MLTATVAELAENQSFWVHTSPWFHRPRQARLEIPNKRHNGVHWNYGLSVREPKLICNGNKFGDVAILKDVSEDLLARPISVGEHRPCVLHKFTTFVEQERLNFQGRGSTFILWVSIRRPSLRLETACPQCESHQSRAPPAEQEQLKLQGGVLPVGRRCLMG